MQPRASWPATRSVARPPAPRDGKKKPGDAKQKELHRRRAWQRPHAEDAERVFELMNYFSGYGFNKSHSAAYALVAYQCAYLKAHFPVEFLCATMTADRDKIEKVVRTIAEARAMGITVLAPDVNESEIDFAVVYDPAGEPPKRKANQPIAFGGKLRDPMHPKIRFGLGAVKGVGAAALESILEARQKEDERGKRTPFEDLFDFTSRVDLRRVNKGVVEALVQCGAMDSIHDPRSLGRDRASPRSTARSRSARRQRPSARAARPICSARVGAPSRR